MNPLDATKGSQAEMTAWRRELHAYPELAYEEKRTADFIAGRLAAFGLKVHRGLGRTGVVGTLEAGAGGAIALRADMDALPVKEENAFAHRSRNEGRMHACGHDGHAAMLLGAAKYLAASRRFRGIVHFVFQPAEEGGGGAREMIKDGLFEKFPCDAVYGMHNWPDLPLGRFGVKAGPLMASSDKFEIELRGRGCHAAAPHNGVDLVAAAAALVQSLQTVVSRSVDPAEPVVLSVTQLHAGDAYNVIPCGALLRGTVRAFSPGVQELVERRMREICGGLGSAFGAEVELRYTRNYPATVNDEKQAAVCAAAAAAVVGEANVVKPRPVMGAEDFSFMLQRRPGCYVLAGSGLPSLAAPLHNPGYDFNDDLLPLGAAYWAELAERVLAP